MTDLEEAISMLRESLPLSRAATHKDCLLALKNLACFLEIRFKKNGSQGDFEEATSLRQERNCCYVKMNFIIYLPHHLILVVRTSLSTGCYLYDPNSDKKTCNYEGR